MMSASDSFICTCGFFSSFFETETHIAQCGGLSENDPYILSSQRVELFGQD